MTETSLSSHVRVTTEEHDRYVADGWWGERSLGEIVAEHASATPDRPAFIGSTSTMTWAEYDAVADDVATRLLQAGLRHGDRVAVLLPDSPMVHAIYVGIERAGLITAGIGPRAGRREIEHLLAKTGAVALVSPERHREMDFGELFADGRVGAGVLRHHFTVGPNGVDPVWNGEALCGPERPPRLDTRTSGLGPGELFLLNSTSGTTGLPKVVMHTMNRWYAFHKMAVDAAQLSSGDVFMSVIPAPFGFGLWTAHFTPTMLGAPCVVMERFNTEAMIEAIERYKVTVLGAVSTQFIMMLGSPALAEHDVSSLRVMFTGGEAVPYDRAAKFEEETGASVLQFFGSNETGALSYTSSRDTREQRLRTAGHVIPVMDVRLFDDDGADVTATGGPGQPGCRGPVTCLGYYGDAAATDGILTDDGWMLTGDIVTIDEDGYLRVVGRKSDFIIRGGKNISAPAVEEAVLTVPGVRMAAAVAMPSDVYGEKVCVYVVPEEGVTIDLATICATFAAAGLSKEMWPEGLVIVGELPQASGGKVAKSALRDDARSRHDNGGIITR